jgi:hypothetical protein
MFLLIATAAHGVSLDDTGSIKLGVRTYTAARIGTQVTDHQICDGIGPTSKCSPQNATNPADPTQGQSLRSLTFPVSSTGHLRQNRFYIEAELDHDLQRLLADGFGPFQLLDYLPLTISKFKYHLTFRGEAEGVYDYGPAEYRTAYQYFNQVLVPTFSGRSAPIGEARQRLRRISVHRERLFQAYLETEINKVFIRFGRQILSWGETDVFRLLDNINPLDNSFGGFLTPLDERRVPLDMLLLNYHFGDVGPFSEVWAEAYAAIDNSVGFDPGIPEGSPWALPNLGAPSATLATFRTTPERVVKDTRGGFRLNFIAPIPGIEEANFSFAQYWTYLDVPEVETVVSRAFPLSNIDTGPLGQGFLAVALQSAPRVSITGAALNFAFPYDVAQKIGLSGQPIIRSELAYFAGEARQTQRQLDPFLFASGGCNSANGGQRVTVQPGSPVAPVAVVPLAVPRYGACGTGCSVSTTTSSSTGSTRTNPSLHRNSYKHLNGLPNGNSLPDGASSACTTARCCRCRAPRLPIAGHHPAEPDPSTSRPTALNTLRCSTLYYSGQLPA